MDKYDAQIEDLKKYPEDIKADWLSGHGLFRMIPQMNGCLTMVRAGNCCLTLRASEKAKELFNKIQTDKRLPATPDSITVADLPVFAEYQRLVDETLRKNPNEAIIV